MPTPRKGLAMTTDIKVPVLPESVADATIAVWHKQPGEAVERDENLVDIETDKVVLEVVAQQQSVVVSQHILSSVVQVLTVSGDESLCWLSVSTDFR